jgi:hypothetical protein
MGYPPVSCSLHEQSICVASVNSGHIIPYVFGRNVNESEEVPAERAKLLLEHGEALIGAVDGGTTM